jgi:hypothetical protein
LAASLLKAVKESCYYLCKLKRRRGPKIDVAGGICAKMAVVRAAMEAVAARIIWKGAHIAVILEWEQSASSSGLSEQAEGVHELRQSILLVGIADYLEHSRYP